jgi:hypothetical protein
MHQWGSARRVRRDRFASPVVLRALEHRPIGTNGYVSTWGAITSTCPPDQV